ncbi:hypothetical protein GOBAR_DD04778 [Gossypium barbadense]|nr:hypothetical protein GOBAR_DD04778 [Gossypium barbadense]
MGEPPLPFSFLMEKTWDPNIFNIKHWSSEASSNSTGSNFNPPDSPESDRADQSNFEFPEDWTLDGWLEDYPETIITGPIQFPFNQADEVNNDSARTSSLLQKMKLRGKGGTSEKDLHSRPSLRLRYWMMDTDGGNMGRNGNYYRCSIDGCPVKKRVERDKEDPRRSSSFTVTISQPTPADGQLRSAMITSSV